MSVKTVALNELKHALDRSNPLPLYEQLRDAMRAAIRDRNLGADGALPPERDIAKWLGVSRITLRKAVDGLVDEGLLERRRGAGTFVNHRIEKSTAALSSFSEDMATRGWQVKSQWLDKRVDIVHAEEALTTGIVPGTRVFRFDRIRIANDVPLAIEHAVIPADLLDSPDSVATSLYAALEKTGNRPVKALQKLQATAFDAEQARLLDIDAGAPALLIERRGFDSNDRIVEVTRSWYRGDSYDFVTELSL